MFKAKVTLAQSTERFNAHPYQITQSKTLLLERAGDVFSTLAERRRPDGPSVGDLRAKIGQFEIENDYLASALGRISDPSSKR